MSDAASLDDADGRVAAAVAELYAGEPESFVGRRTELAAAAREAGDRDAAKAIGALRRPTRTAWVVNMLARADPDAPESLAALGVALQEAQTAKDGRRLRELSAERGSLIDALTQRALDTAGVGDPTPAVRLEVSQTLTAALADPGTAARFAAGTLTRAVQWSGFGVLPADGDDEAADAEATLTALTRAPSRAPTRARLKAVPDKPDAPATRRQAEAAERRQAQAEQRAAREAAEREAQRREEYEQAKRAAAAATDRAVAAVGAEERLEGQVRELEEGLVKARAELTDARLRARQAEAAERKARQALARLPEP